MLREVGSSADRGKSGMGSTIKSSVSGNETGGTGLSIETSPSSPLVSENPLQELTCPARAGEIISGRLVLPPLSNAINGYATLSALQLLENGGLKQDLQRLMELSLSHSVQNASKRVLVLLQSFKANPTVTGWKQVSNAIKKLLSCNSNESSDLLKLYKNISEYYDLFFNIQQTSCDSERILNCYEGKTAREGYSSVEVSLAACLVHAFIRKAYRQTTDALNKLIEQHLQDEHYSITEISKSLIRDGKNSDIYDLLCGDASPLKNFSIGLHPSETQEKSRITMQWQLSEEYVDRCIKYRKALEASLAEPNKALNCLGCSLSLRIEDGTLNVDFELPTNALKEESTATQPSRIKVNLSDEVSFAIGNTAFIASRSVLENFPEQIGIAIQNAQKMQRYFSSSGSYLQLSFFLHPTKGLARDPMSRTVIPFVQLNCPPFKISLPLSVFNGTTDDGQENSQFLKTLHEIDNKTLIKELSLGYGAFSSEFSTMNILIALKTLAQATVQKFPDRSLTLSCKRDDSGHIWARVNFNEDVFNPNFEKDPICAANAIYDVHGFFRGVLETKDTAKTLSSHLKAFPKNTSIAELAKKIEEVHFDQAFLALYGNLTNEQLIKYVLSNRVLWCSGEKGFFIGSGRAFIPDSWEE